MADLNLDEKDKVESVPISRFNEVSSKNIENAKKAEESDRQRAEAEVKTQAAEKKASLYKDLSRLSAKYPGATDHLDEIETKVLAGYDPEDAMLSVLNKAGKLNSNPDKPDSPAGGSATTSPGASKNKKLTEMSRDEKRQQLVDAENRGDLSIS